MKRELLRTCRHFWVRWKEQAELRELARQKRQYLLHVCRDFIRSEARADSERSGATSSGNLCASGVFSHRRLRLPRQRFDSHA